MTTPNSNFARLLSAFATELSRLDTAVVGILNEAIPGLSQDGSLLDEWENDLALPEPCITDPDSQTEAERQAAAHAKYTSIYGLSEQFFIDFAASLGISITISTGGGVGTPFRADAAPSAGGDGDVTRVGPYASASDPASRVWSVARLHVWVVTYASSEPNTDLMRCFFEIYKPAHTIVEFVET